MYLLAIQLPSLHAFRQDGVPMLQDVILADSLQQAPHLHEIFIPACRPWLNAAQVIISPKASLPALMHTNLTVIVKQCCI